MSARSAANLLACATFLILVGVAYAGADHPPPPGFIAVVGLAAACALAVRWFVPRVLGATGKSALMMGAAGGGACGLLCAVSLIVLGPGEPTVTPTAADHLVFAMVLAVAGCVGGLGLAVLARLLTRGEGRG